MITVRETESSREKYKKMKEVIIMKNFKVNVIAAMAVMAAAMLTGCGDVVVSSPDAETVDKVVSAVQQETAPTNVNAQAAAIAAQGIANANQSAQPAQNTQQAAPAAQQAQNTQQTAQTTQPVQQTQNAQPAQQNAQPAKTEAKAENKSEVKTEKKSEIKAVTVNSSKFVGSYVELSQGVANMDISDNGDGTFAIHIDWAVNSNEENIWEMTGNFDGKGTLNYFNCRKSTSAYDKNGNYTIGVDGIQTPFTTYTAGSGSLTMTSYGIVWTDNMGDIFAGTTFVAKKSAPANTKANEIGTAGSNYYNNETANTKANEIGTAGSCYYNNEIANTKASEVATAGSCYYENEPDTPAAELPTGWMYDGNGSGAVMNIAKNGNTYSFVVSYRDEKTNAYHTYSFSGKYENGKLVYSAGQQDDIVYNADGTVKSASFVSNDHRGTVTQSNTGIVWADSYGPNFVFIGYTL